MLFKTPTYTHVHVIQGLRLSPNAWVCENARRLTASAVFVNMCTFLHAFAPCGSA